MKHRTRLIIAAAVGLAGIVGGTSFAYAAMLQGDGPSAAALRASGQVGEQANGYLGLVGPAPAELRNQVDSVNIKRRAAYTDLAARRGAKIEEVGATMACEIFASSVLPGQYYRLPDGIWRQRQGNEPIPRPSYCG